MNESKNVKYVCSMCGTQININGMTMLAHSNCSCKPNLKTKEMPAAITKEEYEQGIRTFIGSS